MLATLVAPTSGEVALRRAHRRARSAPALRARIGLLAHELHLYPELTARQNLAFFARALRPRRASAPSTRRSRARASPIAPTTTVVGLLARHAPAARARARAAARAAPGAARRAVHRPRRSRGRRRRRSAARARAPAARSSSSRRTISISPTAWSRASRSSATDACCRDEPASPGLRARYRALVGAAPDVLPHRAGWCCGRTSRSR